MSKFYRNKTGFLAALRKGGGLYIATGATLLVLLSVGILLSREPSEPNVPAVGSSVLQPSDSDVAALPTDGATDSVQTQPSASEPSTDPTVDPPTQDVVLSLPVNGTVGTGFSLTVPVFSETMQDWRVHQGIDYRTEGEVDVLAAADGIVDQVYYHELMGHTVEILHADGLRSIYQSLAEEGCVIEGQQVFCGDVIGRTGTSAECESAAGTHLHFALIEAGVYLDPEDRLIP